MSRTLVEYVDSMGDDDSVVNAARVSFAKDGASYDAYRNHRLIRYLAREGHELPFAHTAVTLRCKAPLPQRVHCFKSKIGFVENEESRRYISSEPELFVPEFRAAAEDKKQGSGGRHEDADHWADLYRRRCLDAIMTYKGMIASGIAPEQARYILPQGVMVNWIWTGSLLAYARFYNLRSKPDTQKETRDVADAVGIIMAGLFPVSWDALTS